jgi:hypothetical protein
MSSTGTFGMFRLSGDQVRAAVDREVDAALVPEEEQGRRSVDARAAGAAMWPEGRTRSTARFDRSRC